MVEDVPKTPEDDSTIVVETKPKRGRGRPKKSAASMDDGAEAELEAEAPNVYFSRANSDDANSSRSLNQSLDQADLDLHYRPPLPLQRPLPQPAVPDNEIQPRVLT